MEPALARRSPGRGDDGFTILETTIALGLVFVVLTGLLAGLAGSVRAVVGGRQRTAALALATEVLEQSRALAYGEIGHDLTGDGTLDTDPAVTGSGADRAYQGEPLAASLAAGGRPPFSPHRWSTTVGPATYTVSAYATVVAGEGTDPVKRVTATVTWGAGEGPAQQVRLSTLVYDAVSPPDPLLIGSADADLGRIRVSGYLQNMDLADATIFLPYAKGELESRFIRRIRGFASTVRSRMAVKTSLSADDLTGCLVTDSNKVAECPGAKAESVADNDTGTAPAEHDPVGPRSTSGGVVERKSLMRLVLSGTTEARSRSTSMACDSCGALDMGDGDRLPWHRSEAGGATSGSMPFTTGSLTGQLAVLSGTWRSVAGVDRDDAGDNRVVSATATATIGTARVATFDGSFVAAPDQTLVPYAGVVKVGGADLGVSAAAGPGAGPATVTAGTVPVDLWDPATAAYRRVDVVPGTRREEVVAPFSLLVDDAVVTVSATVTAREQVVETRANGASVTVASANLNHWLEVVARVVVVRNGNTVADLTVDLDYGRLVAATGYTPA